MQRAARALALAIASLWSVSCLEMQKQITWPKYRGPRKRIAVHEFENKSGQKGSPLGAAVSDMIEGVLVETGHFQVISRRNLERVMEEQRLGRSGAVTRQTAAKIGQLIGAEALVFGAITEYGLQESTYGGEKEGEGAQLSIISARVVLDVRMVDTDSGEIILAQTATGEEATFRLEGTSYDSFFNVGSDFNTTLGGKATRKAVRRAVKGIIEAMDAVPWRSVIVAVKPTGEIFIKHGKNMGLEAGEVFSVFRPGEEIIDPETGASLGREMSRIGRIQITEVRDQYSVAQGVDGFGFKVGDVVEKSPLSQPVP